MRGIVLLTSGRSLIVLFSEQGLTYPVDYYQNNTSLENKLIHIGTDIVFVEFEITSKVSHECSENFYCEADETCVGCVREYATLKINF